MCSKKGSCFMCHGAEGMNVSKEGRKETGSQAEGLCEASEEMGRMKHESVWEALAGC